MLLQHKQKGSTAAHSAPKAQTPAEVVGADNAGHMVMLKPQSKKRQAEAGSGEEAALDTHQAQLEQAVTDSRSQEGQEGELTLEQRVNALQLQQRPAGVYIWRCGK